MKRSSLIARAALFAVGVLFAAGSVGQQTPPAQPAPTPAKPAGKAAVRPAAPELEARAIDLLKAMSARLAAARSMSFTAVVTYESPSRIGPALAYMTTSEVLMHRPDKLRVITLGDGPASEFYFDGKTMTAFSPAENLVAVAPAPPTVDAMLKVAFDSAAIYFPFTDVLVDDPYTRIADALTVAFYVGQSKVVGGTTTDIVAIASEHMFVQIWIGAEDKLPRMMRAVFRGDPLRLRHQLEMSNWKLDPVVGADAFASQKAASATSISFGAPQPAAAQVNKTPARAKAAAKAASQPQ
jgi:hypothetical protein